MIEGSVLTAMVEGYDPDICGKFCAPFNLKPSCVEEHEACHVAWIQAEVTWEEFKELVHYD